MEIEQKEKDDFRNFGYFIYKIGLKQKVKNAEQLERIYRGTTISPLSLIKAVENVVFYIKKDEEYFELHNSLKNVIDKYAESLFNGYNKKSGEYIPETLQNEFYIGLLGRSAG